VLEAAAAITIAVVDTGADIHAPDLAAKSPATWSVLRHTSDVTDYQGHGTFVSSLAAGSTTNAEGVAGFGGDAKLLAIQAGDISGLFTDVDAAAGIIYAVDHGARIITLSFGGPVTSLTEQNAIGYAAGHGVLVVAAAGSCKERPRRRRPATTSTPATHTRSGSRRWTRLACRAARLPSSSPCPSRQQS